MIRPVDSIPAKAQLFRSLGDERRLQVLALLDGERRVGELVDASGQPQSTVSTHLSALHAAGLVTRRSAGRHAWYRSAHPAVARMLDAAEEVVLATSGATYVCVSPCCNPAAP